MQSTMLARAGIFTNPKHPLAISPCIVYADPAPGDPSPRQLVNSLLGNSSMVELRTLTPSILVRIQVPQPKF